MLTKIWMYSVDVEHTYRMLILMIYDRLHKVSLYEEYLHIMFVRHHEKQYELISN